MYIWRTESYFIWVVAREKVDDNMGTKVSSTRFNMFCRRVAEIKWQHIQGEIWFYLMFLGIEMFLKLRFGDFVELNLISTNKHKF